MKKMKENRGAALVAVLIGILFIAILASSLLYMSTLNYKMKGMRSRANDNFYTAEYAMADMLAQIKQMSYASDTPKTTLSGYLKGSGNSFNAANLQKLIGYQTGGGSLPDLPSAKVGCIFDGSVASYEEGANYIKLKGVKITTTTDDDYESSIVTDIKISFPKSTDAPAKLNDFSLLSDAPLSIKESSQYFGGDIYIRKNGTLGDGGNDALRIGPKGNLVLMGNFCFIDGNLTIEDGGNCYLNGTTYVRGQVIVNGDANLVIGGDLYCRDGSSGNISCINDDLTKNHGSSGVKWANYNKYDAGLAGMLVAPYMHIHKSNASSEKDITFTQSAFRAKCSNAGRNYGTSMVEYSGGPNGTVRAVYMTNNQNVPGGENYSNCLIVGGGCPTMFQGYIKNSTFLIVDNSQPLEIAIQDGGFEWGTMDDESYEIARKLWVKGGDNDGQFSFPGENGFTLDNLEAVTGTTDESKLNGKTLVQFTNDADCKPFYYNKSKPNENYFPFDNFLDKNINKTLREFKGAAGGDADASAQPTIRLYNWSKE